RDVLYDAGAAEPGAGFRGQNPLITRNLSFRLIRRMAIEIGYSRRRRRSRRAQCRYWKGARRVVNCGTRSPKPHTESLMLSDRMNGLRWNSGVHNYMTYIISPVMYRSGQRPAIFFATP